MMDRVTITIVGAGVIGCAIAHALAARGARVQVVDPRGPGAGATRASAGILSPHIEGHEQGLLDLCLRSFEAWDGFMEALGAATPRIVPYARRGTLQVARGMEDAAALERLAGELAARGVAHALVAEARLRELEPALDPRVTRGLLVETHGFVGARALTAALVDAAHRHGAVFARRRALAIDTSHAIARVVTEAGVMASDAVIVAAGSWSGSIDGVAPAASPVTPVRGQLLELRFDAPRFERVIWGPDVYLVPWPDGTVLVGATVEDVGFDERSTAGAVAALLEAAHRLVPALRDAAFRRVRVGLRPATADTRPIIGRSSTRPRLYFATGHYRTGILLAPLTARLLADLVLDGHEAKELALVQPGRVGL
jgi:glycine oxidase